ncbi:DUF2004 domain-containing protein [Niastella caeni]|uniref:DUF2004 domain-containing protein n=1 Tax=Niastella caeni TaxID=2569763 RepID=A0A4S8HVE8_9BACT|nr:DUF2004 domain-containing protein [Niastella caeni]THU39161.1 DUF2004 domain-containing protein [Niastella caeni]
MSKYTLPHFEPIDLANLEEYYDTEIEFNGEEVDIDLNFGTKTIAPQRMDLVKKFLENLKDYDSKNRKYIEQDFADEDGDTVKTYVEHHLEEIDKDDLAELVDFNNKSIAPAQQLIKALRLVRVGFYPDGEEDQFAIFDYSIGRDLTDYLVVIFTDENGEMDYITMES